VFYYAFTLVYATQQTRTALNQAKTSYHKNRSCIRHDMVICTYSRTSISELLYLKSYFEYLTLSPLKTFRPLNGSPATIFKVLKCRLKLMKMLPECQAAWVGWDVGLVWIKFTLFLCFLNSFLGNGETFTSRKSPKYNMIFTSENMNFFHTNSVM